jgi:hypothetical protein
VRDVLEELEPGVQEFSTIELIRERDGVAMGTYFLILPPPKLDAIVKEETEFNGRDALKSHGRCMLSGSIIKGHHLWRGDPQIMVYFCSDELHDRLRSAKLDGWDLRHRCSVTTSTGGS